MVNTRAYATTQHPSPTRPPPPPHANDTGLVGELEEVEADEAGQQGGGPVDDHIVVVGLELPLEELELVGRDRLDDVLPVRGGEEEHAGLALAHLRSGSGSTGVCEVRRLVNCQKERKGVGGHGRCTHLAALELAHGLEVGLVVDAEVLADGEEDLGRVLLVKDDDGGGGGALM